MNQKLVQVFYQLGLVSQIFVKIMLHYKVTRYTKDYEPISYTFSTLDAAKNGISTVSRSKRKNGSVYTIDCEGVTIEVIAETDGFVPYTDTNVPYPNDSHPNKIRMNINDIPEFFGKDLCERFRRWMDFYNQGIIFYEEHE